MNQKSLAIKVRQEIQKFVILYGAIMQEPLNTWTGRLLGIFLTFYPWRILRNDNNITCAAMKK